MQTSQDIQLSQSLPSFSSSYSYSSSQNSYSSAEASEIVLPPNLVRALSQPVIRRYPSPGPFVSAPPSRPPSRQRAVPVDVRLPIPATSVVLPSYVDNPHVAASLSGDAVLARTLKALCFAAIHGGIMGMCSALVMPAGRCLLHTSGYGFVHSWRGVPGSALFCCTMILGYRIHRESLLRQNPRMDDIKNIFAHLFLNDTDSYQSSDTKNFLMFCAGLLVAGIYFPNMIRLWDALFVPNAYASAPDWMQTQLVSLVGNACGVGGFTAIALIFLSLRCFVSV